MKHILMLLVLMVVGAAQAADINICNTDDGVADIVSNDFTHIKDSFNNMDGGDNLLLCKGGSFTKTLNQTLFNKSCSRDAICTISTYGVGERPIINAFGTDGFRFKGLGEDGGYTIKGIHLIGNGNAGIQLSNDVDYVTLDDLYIDGFGTGVHSSGGKQDGTAGNKIHDYLTLKNSTIINSGGRGYLGGGNHVLIENNHFENNGAVEGKFGHNLYISNPIKLPNYPTSDVVIRGNTFYKSSIDSITGKCSGTSVVLHGLLYGALIEGNLVKEDAGKTTGGCWGIMATTGNSQDEEFIDITIRNNTLINMGHNAIGCNSCKNVLIDSNVITGSDPTISNSISVPAKPDETLKSVNVVISNNIITQPRPDKPAIKLGGDNPFILANNIINANECYDLSGANTNTDTSTNICNGGDPVIPPIEPPVEPPIDLPVCVSTSQQMKGLVQRTQNIIDRRGDAKASNNTINNIYDDADDLQIRINSMNKFIDGACVL